MIIFEFSDDNMEEKNYNVIKNDGLEYVLHKFIKEYISKISKNTALFLFY
jgi:hypothetical protein